VAGEKDGKGEKSGDVDYVGARGVSAHDFRVRETRPADGPAEDRDDVRARERDGEGSRMSVSDPSPLRATEMAEITEGSEAGKRGIVRLVISCNI